MKSFTPLHWAAYFGHEAVLELLLENEKLRESWSDDIAIHFNGAGQADEGMEFSIRRSVEYKCGYQGYIHFFLKPESERSGYS